MTTAQLTAVCTLALSLSAAVAPATRAQTEGWLLGPGPKTGKESTIVPTNCVTAADGSITCDTKVENPASDTVRSASVAGRASSSPRHCATIHS